MRTPFWLKTIIFVFLLLGFIGFFLRIKMPCGQIIYNLPEAIKDIIGALTFIVLIYYVYYTYLIARDTCTLSASVILNKFPDDPYHIAVIVQNHSKFSLCCWCNLNAKIYNQPVSIGNFYGGETSMDLQPFGIIQGHFYINDILLRAKRTIDEMEKQAIQGNKEQLFMDVEFWYHPMGPDKLITHNPKQPHYFDFYRKVLVTDF